MTVFKKRCQTKGVHSFQPRTPNNPSFVVGGETPNYDKKYFGLSQQRVPKDVWKLRVIKKLFSVGGGGKIVMGHL